jgi:ABC-type multidrug transport system ATPase subunit
VIAHRLRTALAADRIAVLVDGRIVDTGTHDELLGRCEPYAVLVRDHRDGLRRDPVGAGWVRAWATPHARSGWSVPTGAGSCGPVWPRR